MSVYVRSASIAEVDLAALGENLRQVKKRVEIKKILAVVKASAYGHGAVEVARFLEGEGTGALFAVAFLVEGRALRKAGITLPILLMTGSPAEQIAEIVRYRLTPLLFDSESLFALGRY